MKQASSVDSQAGDCKHRRNLESRSQTREVGEEHLSLCKLNALLVVLVLVVVLVVVVVVLLFSAHLLACQHTQSTRKLHKTQFLRHNCDTSLLVHVSGGGVVECIKWSDEASYDRNIILV
ncbi:hypothetical protein E2C01_006169 [Portunus trituberculatus]|uniref:Uncharacterized protein n=1 Tax=Portunus trituberculatus TaxID=210409 RepID=A0A5B7CXE6_PORTR|nr:hypothetical protein [Portunus trituberculatus]